MAAGNRSALEIVREFALGLPEAYEDYPWGDRVVKVGKKIFLFLGQMEEGVVERDFSLCVKLPHSRDEALELPFTEPAGYGLGKHGWVVARLAPTEIPPVETFISWVEESYRAVAPKKLAARIGEGAGR